MAVSKKSLLANKVEFVGNGTDEFNHRYIKLKVSGSSSDLHPYSMTDLLEPKSRLFPELGNAGCLLLSRSEQNAILERIQRSSSGDRPTFFAAQRLGSFETFFVRPRSIVGQSSRPVERALGSLDPQMLRKYRRKGSLQRWQQDIGSLCSGNSRLMFAVSLACTGPILSFVDGPRTGGFQIVGPAESGKTTAAIVAGSIWGCHQDSRRAEKGFVEDWNTTINKLEETAQAHCDTYLGLDETTLAGATPAGRAAAVIDGMFRLAEGSGKQRLHQNSAAAWRLYFLSTSNLSLDELAEQGGVAIDDQHRGRLVDVVLPTGPGAAGIYEDLHGLADGASLSDELKKRCREIFGQPGYQLVRNVYRSRQSRKSAARFVSARQRFYLSQARRQAQQLGVKPLERATARFATVYAAGCLAAKFGIFLWTRAELCRAILSCQFDSASRARPLHSNPDPFRRLAEYIEQESHAFLNLDCGLLRRRQHRLGSALGYSQTFKGEHWLYLTSEQFGRLAGNAAAARLLAARLVADGAMDCTGSGGKRVQRPVYRGRGNRGYCRVYALRASVFLTKDEPARRTLKRKT